MCKCLIASKKKMTTRCILYSKREGIKGNHVKCVDVTITADGKLDTEVKRRIAMAKDSFIRLDSVFKNRSIRIITKLKILKTYAWSMRLYGCESWTLKRNSEKRTEAAEMWFIRKMMRVTWPEMKM